MVSRDAVVFIVCLGFAVSGAVLPLFGLGRDVADALVLAAALMGGSMITIKSIAALLRGNFGVDVLAAIAIWISIFTGEYLAAAIVMIMLNGGELAEDFTASRSSKAIDELVESSPMTARVRRNGEEVEVSLGEVKIGDIVLVNPSEKIPIDGIVVKGSGLVNQAMITGESIPSEKFIGSTVYGNTILENGTLDIKVTKSLDETVFAHIVKQVEEAHLRRAPVERIADKYARLFAPIILSVAIMTQLVTNNLFSTTAVLVISCPCALTLATPIAVAAGIGNAARSGILTRGGVFIEEVGKCDIVIIDKTGTVTLGKPRVVSVKPLEGHNVRDILSLAGTAEQRSEHSLAKAILEEAKKYSIVFDDPDEFNLIPGYGVAVEFKGHRILVGNLNLMREYGVGIDEELTNYVSKESASGRTAVVVAEDLKVAGVISMADTLREGVKDGIYQMKSVGAKKVVMLTGDSLPVAEQVASQVGIDEVYADLLPADKVKHVQEYKGRGNRVVVVGDGINDTPALASADVGIAMGIAGTDVAIETAGIVLMNDDLGKVADVMRLSKRMSSIVRQNIVFALGINVAGLLLSSQGFISPVYASMIHEGNALIVTLNSLRLLGRIQLTNVEHMARNIAKDNHHRV